MTGLIICLLSLALGVRFGMAWAYHSRRVDEMLAAVTGPGPHDWDRIRAISRPHGLAGGQFHLG